MKFQNYYKRFAKKHKANEKEIYLCFEEQYYNFTLEGFVSMIFALSIMQYGLAIGMESLAKSGLLKDRRKHVSKRTN